MSIADEMSFDSLYIVQSLREGDRKTAEELADALGCQHNGVPVIPRIPLTKSAFLERLAAIAEDTRQNYRSPIVHLETHGTPRGIEVHSGEVITWAELKQPLADINLASRLNLLVVLAACDGGNLVGAVDLTDRAPVWGIIGPVATIDDVDIATDMRAFYERFLGSLDGRASLEALNGDSVGAPWRYGYYPVRFFFRYAYQRYLQEHASPAALKAREDEIVRQVVGSRTEPPGLRRRVRHDLQQHDDHFNAYRRNFFMIDLYEENEDRFPISLEECRRDPRDDR